MIRSVEREHYVKCGAFENACPFTFLGPIYDLSCIGFQSAKYDLNPNQFSVSPLI